MVIRKINFFSDHYFSEFNHGSFDKVLYTKKYKFATKIAYVQDEMLPQHPQIYTGMPVMPETNSRSGEG